jgi:hypothetical protein
VTCDIAPHIGPTGHGITVITMSTGERRMYITIALAFVALMIVLAIGHIPDGG